MGRYTLGVPPTDIEAMSEALYQALSMSPRERRARATGLLNILLQESASTWLQAQLRDLAAQTARPQVVYRTGKMPAAVAQSHPTPRIAPRPAAMRSAAELLDRETMMAARHALVPAASASETTASLSLP
jgi:hypothetical protein